MKKQLRRKCRHLRKYGLEELRKGLKCLDLDRMQKYCAEEQEQRDGQEDAMKHEQHEQLQKLKRLKLELKR